MGTGTPPRGISQLQPALGDVPASIQGVDGSAVSALCGRRRDHGRYGERYLGRAPGARGLGSGRTIRRGF